jgi:hypothetical protein
MIGAFAVKSVTLKKAGSNFLLKIYRERKESLG